MSRFYEENSVLSEYLLFHYGNNDEILPWDFGPTLSLNFPQRVVEAFLDFADCRSLALDIGCAVGRSSFELSKHFESVVGTDYSQPFIDAAMKLREFGELPYAFKKQGEQVVESVAKIPEGANPDRLHFEQGDAMKIHEQEHPLYDLVLASNIICRLPDPKVFLSHINQLLAKNGVFVLSTPYSYLEEFTPKKDWLGGKQNSTSAKESVLNLLSETLEFIGEIDLPMLIREHERKFQWTVCHVTAWRK